MDNSLLKKTGDGTCKLEVSVMKNGMIEMEEIYQTFGSCSPGK